MHRLALALAAVLALAPTPAGAEPRIDDLTHTALHGTTEKGRLAAVTALGRLGDRRTMKPLVGALRDASAKVRAVSATALGKLGHAAALPSLRTAATDDPDDSVRTFAREAAIAVARTNALPAPFAAAPGPAVASAAPAQARKKARAGFGTSPRALASQPDLFVLVNTSTDDSPGKADKLTRKQHAEILKQTLVDACKSEPLVTTVAADAQRLGLDSRHIDVSVTKMNVATVGATIEVEAQLRLAVSDAQGKMLSFLSGGAKVQVPRARFDARGLPNLRREALENAMRGMFDKLVAHLRDRSQT